MTAAIIMAGGSKPSQEQQDRAQDDAHAMALWERANLQVADPWWVSPDLVQIIGAMASSMPSYRFDRSDAPTEHGFVWLSYPVWEEQRGDSVFDLAGFSWSWMTPEFVRSLRWADPTGVDGSMMLIQPYTSLAPDVSDDVSLSPEEMRKMHVAGAIPLGTFVVREGEVLPTDRIGETGNKITSFIAALWAVARQKLAVVEPHRPARTQLRQAAREGVNTSNVNVIVLRQSERRQSEEPEEHDVQWTHRWIQRKHWRRQHYATLGPARTADGEFNEESHRPILIGEQVHGPPDKPLIIKDRVFSVSR
jgi:hypothetical protein